MFKETNRVKEEDKIRGQGWVGFPMIGLSHWPPFEIELSPRNLTSDYARKERMEFDRIVSDESITKQLFERFSTLMRNFRRKTKFRTANGKVFITPVRYDPLPENLVTIRVDIGGGFYVLFPGDLFYLYKGNHFIREYDDWEMTYLYKEDFQRAVACFSTSAKDKDE